MAREKYSWISCGLSAVALGLNLECQHVVIFQAAGLLCLCALTAISGVKNADGPPLALADGLQPSEGSFICLFY